jgi:tetratricopeptide (TPR) repeat protein
LIVYNTPYLADVLARAYLKIEDLDSDISTYERLVTFNPHSNGIRLIHPKYYYRLAKLYEKKGEDRKAIEHYEKFLDLWKDADPGITEVENARERLAGLSE